MYPSYFVSKRLILVPILVVVATQLLFMCSVSSLNMTNAYLHHKCLASQGKYKPGSQHEKDLNRAIQKLSKNMDAFSGGYAKMGYGDVYVTFQCRGDSYGPNCRSCFATTQSELSKRCPRDKGAIIWYDQCLLEFSSIDTGGKINYDNSLCISNAKNLSGDSVHADPVSVLFTLLNNLTKIAVTKKNKFLKNADYPALYAAGEKRLGKAKMYVMVQCTDDLTIKACEECMSYIIVHFFDCYGFESKPLYLKRGARVLGTSCNFRFELYPFINAKTSINYSKF